MIATSQFLTGVKRMSRCCFFFFLNWIFCCLEINFSQIFLIRLFDFMEDWKYYWQRKSNNNLRTGVRIWNITHSLFTISDRRGKFKRINIFMRICVQERERAHEQNRLIPLPSLSQNGIKTSEADVHQTLLYTSLTRIVEGNGREYISSSPPEEGEIKFPSAYPARNNSRKFGYSTGESRRRRPTLISRWKLAGSRKSCPRI